MHRNDGLDNPFSPNSGSVTWIDVEQAAEDSDAVQSYDRTGGQVQIGWCDGNEESFSDPIAAMNAIRAMEAT